MLYRLIVLNGPARGQRLSILDAPATLGRDADCTFAVPDDEIAFQHAVLEHTADGLFIRDLGTMSHVIVNNREVSESRLKHGDIVELGKTRFLVQVAVQAEVNGDSEAPLPPRRSSALGVLFSILFMIACGGAVVWWLSRAPSGDRYLGPEFTDINRATAPAAEPRQPDGNPESTSSAPPFAAVTVPPETNAPPDRGLAPGMPSAVSATEPPPVTNAVSEPTGATAPAIPPPAEAKPHPAAIELSKEETELPPVSTPRSLSPSDLIAVGRADLTRFPDSGNGEDMRILKVTLDPKVPVDTLDASDVRVTVAFYEEDAPSGRMVPSTATVKVGPILPEGPWLPRDTKTVEATYVARGKAGHSHQSVAQVGFVVRVYYRDTLQDVHAKPVNVLQLAGEKP